MEISAKEYVQQRFIAAAVIPSGELFVLKNVPGLDVVAESEDLVWSGAAKDLADPLMDSVRGRAGS